MKPAGFTDPAAVPERSLYPPFQGKEVFARLLILAAKDDTALINSLPIENGKNGFLVSSVEEAAERIGQMLKGRELCRRLGQEARAAVPAEIPFSALFRGTSGALPVPVLKESGIRQTRPYSYAI